MLANCLYVTVVWMFESTFFVTVLLNIGTVCQLQWKILLVYESLNPYLSMWTCPGMRISNVM